jgi:hypothetical protein
MKTGLLILLALSALGLRAQNNPTNHPPDQVFPSIVMDEVPLKDAVKNLARQAGINYIFDPRVTASYKSELMISERWEKVTALQALNNLLADHKLKLTTNVSSQVVRVVFASDPVKPSTASLPPSDADKKMPLIIMDEVSLQDAILNLARVGHFKVELDPALSTRNSGFNGVSMASMVVNFRWENLTTRQTLDAILENYGLELTDDPKGSEVKIVTKAKSATNTVSK